MEKFRCSHVHKGNSFSHFDKIRIQSTLGLKQAPRMAVMRSVRQEDFGKGGGLCCSVAKLSPTLCNPMGCSMPGFPALHI